MENEILFERLIDAIKTPDWWTLGITSVITIANVCIMVYLGWMQYKLQKQQVCIQEYPVNQRLYSLVREMDIIIHIDLLHLLVYYPSSPKMLDDFCFNKIEKISKCIDELGANRIDFELKFSEGKDIVFVYECILGTIRSIYQSFCLNHSDKNLEQVKFLVSTQDIWKDDNKIMEIFLLLFDDENEISSIKLRLQNYIEKKSYLKNYYLLDKIRNRCYGG